MVYFETKLAAYVGYLSAMNINAIKDWRGYEITNVGKPTTATSASQAMDAQLWGLI